MALKIGSPKPENTIINATANELATHTSQGTILSAFHKDTRLALRNVPDDSGCRAAGRDYCLEDFVSARGGACDKKSARCLRISEQLPLPFRCIGRKPDAGVVALPVSSRRTYATYVHAREVVMIDLSWCFRTVDTLQVTMLWGGSQKCQRPQTVSGHEKPGMTAVAGMEVSNVR